MRRRDFITVLGGAAAAWPNSARAQQPAMPVIGFLNPASPKSFAARVVEFRRGLAEVGYVEGRDVAIEFRWAEGHTDRLPALAAELVALRPAVLVATGGGASAIAAKQATASIPIVFTLGNDPVKAGLVASLNRPGGNITGVTLLSQELVTKRFEVLHELVPAAKTIAILINPLGTNAEPDAAAVLAAGRAHGLQISVFRASTESEIERAFASLGQQPEALLVDGDAVFESMRDHIVALAARYAIPAIFDTRDYVEAGGLVNYGPDYGVAYREAGAYVGRILRGAKPADLPVLQLSTVKLVINLKTAKILGLAIPQSLLARADEVIE